MTISRGWEYQDRVEARFEVGARPFPGLAEKGPCMAEHRTDGNTNDIEGEILTKSQDLRLKVHSCRSKHRQCQSRPRCCRINRTRSSKSCRRGEQGCQALIIHVATYS